MGISGVTELLCIVLLPVGSLGGRGRGRAGGGREERALGGQKAGFSCREYGAFCTAGCPQMARITFPDLL